MSSHEENIQLVAPETHFVIQNDGFKWDLGDSIDLVKENDVAPLESVLQPPGPCMVTSSTFLVLVLLEVVSASSRTLSPPVPDLKPFIGEK